MHEESSFIPEVLLHVAAVTLLSLPQEPQDALLKGVGALVLGKLWGHHQRQEG